MKFKYLIVYNPVINCLVESIGPENLQQVSLPAINKEDNCQSFQGYQLPASSQSGIVLTCHYQLR